MQAVEIVWLCGAQTREGAIRLATRKQSTRKVPGKLRWQAASCIAGTSLCRWLPSLPPALPELVSNVHGGKGFHATTNRLSAPAHLPATLPRCLSADAISAVGMVLEHYDTDKRFPAWGFGAALPPAGTTSHCFALNGDPSRPEVEGVKGILQAYRWVEGRGVGHPAGLQASSLPPVCLPAARCRLGLQHQGGTVQQMRRCMHAQWWRVAFLMYKDDLHLKLQRVAFA